MNNPETVVRLGTQDTGGRQTKHKPNHEQSRNSGKIGHRRKTNKTQTDHEQEDWKTNKQNTNRIMNNPETVVRLGKQDTGGRQTKHKPNHEQSRNSGKIGHTRYRRKTNKTQTES